ncbi:glycosyl transferase [Pseudomonas daroniae]|uniref:Glycosyl transferase n=1 Tax=Phytopseudomonas daroniae TaxID=2487519 RepID=A0A4Q9QS00_9GAMM|nr:MULTISPECIES: glycosyltransferase family A protein [Pseudomonas]TBU83008.1 glycosyl transferase [Pseudomonas sp. FRB 228]TBU83979.1 glycosyl transferase [Pseudomonas daroniae]TBU93157.1 glycosyl transferase [Pseudomonas daroniae]
MKPAELPLVSVIVPCYNYAAYVADALRSVLEQEYDNFELIVVDDGSRDESVPVIERTLQAFRESTRARRIEFIQQENQGVSAALNAGLARAQGTYIATFDADDVMPAGRLALQAAYLQEHPEVGCLGGVAVRIDERGAILPKKDKNRPIRRYDFDQALAAALVVGGNIAVYRRDAMMKVGGYDPAIKVQDFQMTLKVAHAGYFVDILPDVVTLYRKHPDSLSKNYKSEYDYGLQVIYSYKGHKAYASAKARLITKALRMAVMDDKKYAWSLLRQVPLREWDRQLLKRVRHLLLKKGTTAGNRHA